MMGMPVIRASFDQLEHSVRTGLPAIELAAADGLWPWASMVLALRQSSVDGALFERPCTMSASTLRSHSVKAPRGSPSRFFATSRVTSSGSITQSPLPDRTLVAGCIY